jgi:hypothetical protein
MEELASNGADLRAVDSESPQSPLPADRLTD